MPHGAKGCDFKARPSTLLRPPYHILLFEENNTEALIDILDALWVNRRQGAYLSILPDCDTESAFDRRNFDLNGKCQHAFNFARDVAGFGLGDSNS